MGVMDRSQRGVPAPRPPLNGSTRRARAGRGRLVVLRRARTAASAPPRRRRPSRVAERLQLLGRRQQQLLDDQPRDLVDARARFGGSADSFSSSRSSSALPDRLEPLPQRDDRRDGAARLAARPRTSRPLRATIASARAISLARRARFSRTSPGGRRCCRGRPVRFRRPPARRRGHGDVDDEQRPVAPRPHDRLDARLGEDRRGGTGRGDHDVAAPSAASSSSHGAARAADRFAVRAACAIVRLTIVICCTPCDFMCTRGQLAHLAGADDDDVAALSRRRSSRERDRRVADRHRARAEAGFRAHALADAERRVEQPVEHRAVGLDVARGRYARP